MFKRLSRRFVGRVLLLAASTLVSADLVCAASCLGGEVTSRAGGSNEASACHESSSGAETVFSDSNDNECARDHRVTPTSIVVSRQSALSPPAVSMSVGAESTFVLTQWSIAADRAARSGPSGSFPLPLRI
jgi:hypothetical protein